MTGPFDLPLEGTVVVAPPPLPSVVDGRLPPDVIAIPTPGPRGRPGSSGAGFTFTQEIEQSVWVITHNLGRVGPVGFQVVSLDYETIWDNVLCQRVSADQVRLIFDDPTSGHALIL